MVFTREDKKNAIPVWRLPGGRRLSDEAWSGNRQSAAELHCLAEDYARSRRRVHRKPYRESVNDAVFQWLSKEQQGQGRQVSPAPPEAPKPNSSGKKQTQQEKSDPKPAQAKAEEPKAAGAQQAQQSKKKNKDTSNTPQGESQKGVGQMLGALLDRLWLPGRSGKAAPKAEGTVKDAQANANSGPKKPKEQAEADSQNDVGGMPGAFP